MTPTRTVLLLEDDAMIAESLCSDLETMGLRVIGPAFNCSSALELLLGERPDFAILDTHLGSETCEAVIDECAAQHIPVIISSAHSLGNVPTFAIGFPLLRKPYLNEHLVSLVQQLN